MLRRRAAGLTTALVALALAAPAAASADCAGADADPLVQGFASAGAATVCLLNSERSGRGLVAVVPQGQLNGASQAYSDLMVQRGFFAHETPEGITLAQRLSSAGYLGSAVEEWTVGENLAWGQGVLATPRAIVDAWMNSPGHRANILNPTFTEIGIGITSGTPAAGPAGATYTTDFGWRTVGTPGAAGGATASGPSAGGAAGTAATTAARPLRAKARKAAARRAAAAKRRALARKARAARAAKARAAVKRARAARSAGR